jgi:hypothetical protein
MANFIKQHNDKIEGMISCFDRVILTGTVEGLGYAQGITNYFYANKIRIFDFTKWAEPFRDEIRQNAEKISKENNLKIEFIRKIKDFRKDERIEEIISQRGDHPGLIHIFSAMETCFTYYPWYDKKKQKAFLKFNTGRCIHYYYYFIDPELGLCYLRVPTWAPFRLQFYFNGHNLLANKMEKENIDFVQIKNAFVKIEDFQIAQELSDQIDVKKLHKVFDKAAHKYCPVIRNFPKGYHWSIAQAEYATDIIFKNHDDLAPIYEDIVRTCAHAVKADRISMFLGKKLTANFEGELGSRFVTRIEGNCISHFRDKTGIKMYDKFGIVLRIETYSNDITFFKHYRKVDHRDGTSTMKFAKMRKSIYSLNALGVAMIACNRRYLAFISEIDDPTNGIRDVQKTSERIRENGRSYRGFNLFYGNDAEVFRIICRGEFSIYGFRNKDIRNHLPDSSPWQVSSILKRLRIHGIIKKAGKSYKYYLTSLGKRIVATSLKLKEMFIIPYLRGLHINS